MPNEDLGPPWGAQPSLKLKCNEVGIEFNAFIKGLSDNRSDASLAKDFNVPLGTISNLREQFLRFGVDSVVGQD